LVFAVYYLHVTKIKKLKIKIKNVAVSFQNLLKNICTEMFNKKYFQFTWRKKNIARKMSFYRNIALSFYRNIACKKRPPEEGLRLTKMKRIVKS
jgi:hypothetical protein